MVPSGAAADDGQEDHQHDGGPGRCGAPFGCGAGGLQPGGLGESGLVGWSHRIDDYPAVDTGLALSAQPWARVGRSWLDVLPEGAAIGPIAVPGAGEPSTAVPGRADLLVGTLLVVRTSGGGTQHYLAGRDTLQPITELQYAAGTSPGSPSGRPWTSR